MNNAIASRLAQPRPLTVLCAPYHLYTHHDALAGLFAAMAARGWEVSMLLPFTAVATVDSMAREAQALDGVGRIHDFSARSMLAARGSPALQRLLRAIALLLYFVRCTGLLLRKRPDALLLTSDLGGVSVRFVQLLARALGSRIFTLQTTLFLKVAERDDLKFSFRPNWLHRLLSRGIFKKLFLFFGEVPGSFLPDSHVGVQDAEIRDVCIEFGKRPEFIKICGSLQAAKIRAAASARGARNGLPRVLFLSECISERYGVQLGLRNIEWMRACAQALAGRAACTVRFHPRESDDYRRQFMEALGEQCVIDPEPNAVQAAAHADVIVGAYSMLMFDAQAAGIQTVFIDVGEDPLGFYSERRTPLAISPVELAGHVARAAGSEGGPGWAAANPEQWTTDILEWIEGTVRDR